MDQPQTATTSPWDLEAHALQFGKDLQLWRRRAGWAQDTSMAWGEAAGIPHVFSSTWSQLERGIMRTPGPGVFLALADQNRRIASKAFEGVEDEDFLKRLGRADPVLHEDGEPWDAADYFACYIGLSRWPHPAIEPPVISSEDATIWSRQLRKLFRSTADELQLSPVEATVQALERGPENREDREQLQRVLLGFEDYRPRQLLEMWKQDQAEGGAFDVLDRWRLSHGLPATRVMPPWEPVNGK
jgi:transcriptional regulator with XRE-family HTH domain